MTPRQLFHEVMFYGDFDRLPVWHWAGWEELEREWNAEFVQRGLPANTNRCAYFDVEPLPIGLPINVGLYPVFEEETIEDTPAYRVFRQNDGVVAKDWKGRSCIPHYTDFLFKDRSGWEEYRKRLQPHPDRIAKDIDSRLDAIRDTGRVRHVTTGSLVGWLRNWMGVVNFSYIQHDDPDLIAEVVDTIADLVCWALDQVLPKIEVDLGWGWEDICGSSGPLVHPRVWERCVVPGYRKIADKLNEHGVELFLVDCDGLIDDLMPGWVEGGVNVMFPVQIQPFGADPMAMRKRWGRELRVVGGIDKLVLAKGRAEIDAEIERRLPLMRDGGFVPLPDHLIVPGTPLDNVRYYLDRVREVRV